MVTHVPTLGIPGQEDCYEFQASLSHTIKIQDSLDHSEILSQNQANKAHLLPAKKDQLLVTLVGVLLTDSVSPLFMSPLYQSCLGTMASWSAWDMSQAGGRDRKVLVLPLALPKHILLGFCRGTVLILAVGWLGEVGW